MGERKKEGRLEKAGQEGVSRSFRPLSQMLMNPCPREGTYFKAKVSHVEMIIQQGVGFCLLIRK